MSEFTLKNHYIEQFELTPKVVREVLVFIASDKFNEVIKDTSITECCSDSSAQVVEHNTKSGVRYTIECSACLTKSAMAKTALLAKLSWYQKFSDWNALSNNPLFRVNLVDKIEAKNADTQVYLSLELLAGLNILNRLHDANKKRFETSASVKQKMNLDAVSVLIRAAQKSVSIKLDELGVSLKETSSQKRLKGISEKLVAERKSVIDAMPLEKKEALGELSALFESCVSK